MLGRYTESHDCAVVTMSTNAPADSKRGRNWFHRGLKGLQSVVLRLWRLKREYYLGEWHYHPSGAPHPSSVDIAQMKEISNSIFYRCPEPVMLLIGGDPKNEFQLCAFVFPGNGTMIELRDQQT